MLPEEPQRTATRSTSPPPGATALRHRRLRQAEGAFQLQVLRRTEPRIFCGRRLPASPEHVSAAWGQHPSIHSPPRRCPRQAGGGDAQGAAPAALEWPPTRVADALKSPVSNQIGAPAPSPPSTPATAPKYLCTCTLRTHSSAEITCPASAAVIGDALLPSPSSAGGTGVARPGPGASRRLHDRP